MAAKKEAAEQDTAFEQAQAVAEAAGGDRGAAEDAREAGEEVPIGAAADGGTSRLTAGYEDNPDKPDESSVAQVERLVTDEE